MRLFLIVFILSGISFASEISLDTGYTNSVNNYFQLPNNNSNRVDLPSESGVSIRTRLFWDLNNKYFLYALLAPLELDYQFQAQNNFQFNNTNFSQNQSTQVRYKFNSYRVGFFRQWARERFKFWLGGVLKIRDARIEVEQNSLIDSYSDFGIVPLLGIGAEFDVDSDWSLFTHLDALGASQGYAYDFQFELRYKTSLHYSLGIGYRSLGGGADNDTLKNFAQFDTTYFSLVYNFD